MISNSGHDERGQYSGGQAGDQGGEWTLRSWYNRPWDGILRYDGENAAEVRRYIRNYAISAANNDHIGYDQNWNDRYTYWYQLTQCNYNPANITNDCESDCSAGVLATVKAVGYTLGISKLQNIDHTGYTGSMQSILGKAGFVWLSDSSYRNGESNLIEGDILLNIKSHTATYVEDGTIKGGEAPVTGNKYSRNNVMPYTNSKSAQELQAILSVLGFYDKALGIDGIYGGGTYKAICDFQDKYNLGADGYASVNGITFAKADELMDGKHATIEPNFTGKAVQDMQSAMNLFGFRDQSGSFLTENGNYDDKTLYAVMQFQDAFGLGADGIASNGGVTWHKVDELYNSIHEVTVKTQGDSLNVRKGRGTSYGIVTTIANGSTHKATCSVDGWTYLHDVNGWVCDEYLG